ncbi:hypothetical protein C2E21_4769 [Chlorella sorokiniana]|uniref:Uncharacterized protein n=1 Tax=Chlorella sorokiniana TaxID=3076 RepID=A0A2P6TR98_CHLSO|nr:hypothetical protein C2E21_4769 [Chlorella sorokiniana]|eukprot:PRW56581.1 hypothetical protein C2E21_4769 [Chlorella sorokiniana]
MRRNVALAVLCLALCGAGVRATGAATDNIQAAVAEAVAKILNPTGAASGVGAASGGLLSAMQQSAAGFKQGISSMTAAASAQYEALTEQAEAALAALEAQYCTPATFTPSEKVPATFVGHSMAITFDMGSCTFDDHKWLHGGEKELECIEPSITYVKFPANFTSKYHSAPSFTSKVCKKTKTFGEPVEKVLFVFDGQKAPDMNALVAQITAEVKNVLGTVGSGVQEVIANTKGTVSSLFGKGATSTPSFSMT